ncbi:MAG: hypothetical protein K2V38_23070 [Gemmataceae bacterium]|nr:hypothetical protein [Gemmataceae bacterium]
MNRSAKKQHHEQARKKNKHDLQEHAREAARRGRSNLPLVLLAVVVAGVAAFLVFISFR